MAELREVILKRRSVRKYKNELIPRKNIEEIIKLATWAPSAINRQMWRFVVVTNQAIKNKMAEVIAGKLDEIPEVFGAENNKAVLEEVKWFSTFFKDAPAVIAVFYIPDEGEPWKKALDKGWTEEKVQRILYNQDLQSMGAVIQNLLLAAKDMGYGTCWMTMPLVASEEIEQILGVDPSWKLAAFVPIGKPESVPEAQPRKPLDEILKFV